MRALTLLTVASAGIAFGMGLLIGSAVSLRSRLTSSSIRIPVGAGPRIAPAAPIRARGRARPDRPDVRAHAFTEDGEPMRGYRAADLPDIPVGPYDPDEAAELLDEPSLYEDDDLGPHLIEPRIGEDEPETAGLPARPTRRP
jgi:hypothetical protein